MCGAAAADTSILFFASRTPSLPSWNRRTSRGLRRHHGMLTVPHPSCDSVCQKHVSNGVVAARCQCQRGYSGHDCSVTCPSLCSGKGVCSANSSGAGRCACDSGYSGDACQSQPGCASACSMRGSCVAGVCSCDTGFSGSDCAHDGRNHANVSAARIAPAAFRLHAMRAAATVPALVSEGSGVRRLWCQKALVSEGWAFGSLPRQVSSSCPAQCSGNGHCASGKCKCLDGFSGADCAHTSPTAVLRRVRSS